MKTFERWSASQVDTYLSCNRKWWFNKILGLEVPQHPSAAIGSAVHAELEAYLEGNAPADSLGPIARTALPFAPKPTTVYIERSIEPLKLTAAGLPALGYIDVLNLTEDTPEVLDWKTTSDLKWAKTEDDLRRNVQMTVYAKATHAELSSMGLPAPEFVRLTHVAMLTKAPHRAQRTSTLIDVPTIEKNWAHIETTVRSMRETALVNTPDKVTPTETTCSAYGGCPFRDRCRAMKAVSHLLDAPTNTEGDIMSGHSPNPTVDQAGKASLLAKLAAKKAGTAATPAAETTAPAAPAKAAAPAPTQAVPDAILSRLRGNLAKPTPPVVAAAPVVPPVVVEKAPVTLPVAAGIVPPDAPTNEQVEAGLAQAEADKLAEAQEKAEKKATSRRPRNAAARLEALGYAATALAAMTNEAMHAILDGNIAAPAAPKLEVIEPQPKVVGAAPLLNLEPAAVEAEDTAASYTEGYNVGYKQAEQDLRESITNDVRREFAEADASVPHVTGLQLYIDCRPVSGALLPHHALEDLLSPLMAKVAESAKVAHYSLIPYAQGPAQVAALLSTRLPSGVVVADTRLPATAAALEVLLPYASVVVRGR